MVLTFLFSWLLQLLFHAPLTFVEPARVADTIYWQQSRKLTWDDFRGRPVKSEESVALTSSGIGMVFKSDANGVANIKVTCAFFCKNSWVKDEGRVPEVLQHEQLHFDITELYARKLREAIDKLESDERKWPVVSKIYQQLNRECNERQNAYDNETHHGIKEDLQKTWNEQIDAELKLLEEFQSGA